MGALKLSNRLVFLPVGTDFADEQGLVTEKVIAYYERRSAGGAGLIVVEATAVDAGGKGARTQIMIDRDACIEGLSRLVKAIRTAGDAKVSIQLQHVGGQGTARVLGRPPVAPSAIPAFKEVPHELSIDEIQVIIEKFAQAVRRAKEAGFDAAELHCAHGYLLCGFLSPLSNKRDDEYGGDTDRRARIVIEIITRVRELVGSTFPLFMRISASEYEKGGIDLKETQRFLPMFEKAGIDAVSISAGNYHTFHMTVQPMRIPEGCLVPLAEGVKQVVNIPVVVGGRINDPRMAEEILRKGQADLIGMGRPLIADPDLPIKAKAGKYGLIRKCVADNTCIDRIFSGNELRCMLNPEAGCETEFDISPADQSKKVWVVGAGPGGMEAARVLSMRGHDVTLFEKEMRLGGQIHVAALPPWKQGLMGVIEYYQNALEDLGLRIVFNTEVTPKMVRDNPLDALIIATGSVPAVPNVVGIEKSHVLFADEVLQDKVNAGQKIAILGGSLVGCETAHFLAERGKEVTILEILPEKNAIGMEIGYTARYPLLEKLRQKNVQMYTNAVSEQINEEGIVVQINGERRIIEVDNVVIAVGYVKSNAFGAELEQNVKEIHHIGDCKKARNIFYAISEASAVARSI